MMIEVSRVYVDCGQPHWEIGVWEGKDNLRIEWQPDFDSADERRDYLVRCYSNDVRRRVRRLLDTNTNENAEYGHEWNLYGDANERHDTQPYTINDRGPQWRIVHCEVMLAFGGCYYVTYRRYPLIDAARIEAQ